MIFDNRMILELDSMSSDSKKEKHNKLYRDIKKGKPAKNIFI